jgi:ketosteroid isomerase-like protein
LDAGNTPLKIKKMRTTKEVWDHHCIAFANADIDEVMSDFAENAIYITTNKVICGKDNIRTLYDEHFKTLEKGSVSNITSVTMEGEIILFEWTFDSPKVKVSDGVDTFIIRDGFIVAQTMRSTAIIKK